MKDSMFTFELRGDRSNVDTLKLRETLNMLNYFVNVEGPRDYTNSELIRILKLGLRLQAILMDPELRTYPKVMSSVYFAFNELSSHILSEKPTDNLSTSKQRWKFLWRAFSQELNDWLYSDTFEIQRPYVATALTGKEFVFYVMLQDLTVHRCVFSWNGKKFKLTSQERLFEDKFKVFESEHFGN